MTERPEYIECPKCPNGESKKYRTMYALANHMLKVHKDELKDKEKEVYATW